MRTVINTLREKQINLHNSPKMWEELAIEMDELDQKRAALEMRRKEIEDDAT